MRVALSVGFRFSYRDIRGVKSDEAPGPLVVELRRLPMSFDFEPQRNSVGSYQGREASYS